MDRNALEAHRGPDVVACRSRDGRHDRHVLAREAIEEARLPHVRRTDQRHRKPFAHHRALLRVGEERRPARRACARRSSCSRAIGRIDLLLGKIDARLDVHAKLEERGRDRFHLPRELPGERARRAARGFLARSFDEVRDALGLREVEASIQECAPRELARLRDARAKLDAAAHDLAQHDGTAVPLELEHVFSGIGIGPRKEERDAPVDQRAARLAEIGERRVARLGDARRGARLRCRGTSRPDNRTTPIPPRPGAVAMAAIVSPPALSGAPSPRLRPPTSC